MHRRIQPAVGARLSGRYDWVTGGAPVLGTTRLASLVGELPAELCGEHSVGGFPSHGSSWGDAQTIERCAALCSCSLRGIVEIGRSAPLSSLHCHTADMHSPIESDNGNRRVGFSMSRLVCVQSFSSFGAVWFWLRVNLIVKF